MNANYKTKEYYSINSKDYISTTKDVDMSEHYNRFIHFLKKGATILDVGFGSARDMRFFANMGYEVYGVDNVSEFVDNAKRCGLNVELCDFHNLPYVEKFDAIWACASLLHSNDLPLAFENLYRALKSGGYIYLSMKYGNGSSVENGRFYQYINEESLKTLCESANLSIIEVYGSNDLLKRNNGWINAILAKNDNN